MHGPYIVHSFDEGFFLNLKHIAKRGILLESAQTSSGRAEIYLPFCPHFFVNIHSSNLNKEYNFSFLEECDISIDNHRLHTATENDDHIWISIQSEIRMNRQDRFIKIIEREICQYKEN